MANLKQARETGNLGQFAKERDDATAPGCEAAFNRALDSMVGKSKAVPATSARDKRGG